MKTPSYCSEAGPKLHIFKPSKIQMLSLYNNQNHPYQNNTKLNQSTQGNQPSPSSPIMPAMHLVCRTNRTIQKRTVNVFEDNLIETYSRCVADDTSPLQRSSPSCSPIIQLRERKGGSVTNKQEPSVVRNTIGQFSPSRDDTIVTSLLYVMNFYITIQLTKWFGIQITS